MSTFMCPVVRLGKTGKNPNSDTLCIWNGPQGPVQFKEGAFKEGDLAIFVPADSMVPVKRPEFAFLADNANSEHLARVRGIKLRGVPSVGLLVPIPSPMRVDVGDDCARDLGIVKYVQPQTHSFGTDSAPENCPSDVIGLEAYDIENNWFFSESARVLGPDVMDWVLTEKIHGCNGRVTVERDTGKLCVGSRNRWVKDDGINVWSIIGRRIAEKAASELLRNAVVFFEVYGKVQDLNYGLKEGVDYAIFDVWMKHERQGGFVDLCGPTYASLSTFGLKVVPQIGFIFRGTLREAIEYGELSASGKTTLSGDHIREGVVLRPTVETQAVYGKQNTVGRLITKCVSKEYLSRNNPTEHQ